jgi:hypothetical protein
VGRTKIRTPNYVKHYRTRDAERILEVLEESVVANNDVEMQAAGDMQEDDATGPRAAADSMNIQFD